MPIANPLIAYTSQQFDNASTSKQANVTNASATSSKSQRQHGGDDDELADHLRVVLRGEGLTRASTKQPADFVVDGSDARRGLKFRFYYVSQ